MKYGNIFLKKKGGQVNGQSRDKNVGLKFSRGMGWTKQNKKKMDVQICIFLADFFLTP